MFVKLLVDPGELGSGLSGPLPTELRRIPEEYLVPKLLLTGVGSR